MNRKYLDDIGYTNRHDTWNSDDPRQGKWARERDIYGFDERETWALDHAFACWLYERLKMYLEIDAVNLDFHKFDIDGETLTQNEVIKRILSLLEESFKNSEDASKYDESCDNIAEAARLWAIIINACWW